MVAPLGHVAMGLLWAVPAWFLWDGRISVAFVAFVVSTSLLPDIDYYLQAPVPGFHHHGVMHTALFVVVVAVLVGWLATTLVDRVVKRWWAREEEGWLAEREVYAFVTGGFILGGLSHLAADVLSAPDGSEPIEPLWPVVETAIGLDVVYYADPKWNLGLLSVAVALHAVLAYFDAGLTYSSD